MHITRGARTLRRRALRRFYAAASSNNALSDGGDAAMRILGQDELAFTGEAGSGMAFRSALWRRTERASEGGWKLPS